MPVRNNGNLGKWKCDRITIWEICNFGKIAISEIGIFCKMTICVNVSLKTAKIGIMKTWQFGKTKSLFRIRKYCIISTRKTKIQTKN